MSSGAIQFVRKASLKIPEINPECFKGSFLKVEGFGLGTSHS